MTSLPLWVDSKEKREGVAGPLHDLGNLHKSSGASTWAQPLILWKVEYTFTTFYESRFQGTQSLSNFLLHTLPSYRVSHIPPTNPLHFQKRRKQCPERSREVSNGILLALSLGIAAGKGGRLLRWLPSLKVKTQVRSCKVKSFWFKSLTSTKGLCNKDLVPSRSAVGDGVFQERDSGWVSEVLGARP